MYDFDKIIDRRGTDSVKWNSECQGCSSNDVIGMCIADTDFESPKSIINALKKRLEHPILGYAYPSEEHYQSICQFYSKKTALQIQPHMIVFSFGVLAIVSVSIVTFTNPGDEIIFQAPGYGPLRTAIESNKRVVLENALLYDEKTGKYEIDFESVEKSITSKTKAWVLSNPYNPVGRVFTKKELLKIVDIAKKYNLLIISDEIHGFLNFPSFEYTPIVSLSDEAASRTIMAASPSKLFNVAGLVYAFAVIANEELRLKFNDAFVSTGVVFAQRNTIGLTMVKAAYQEKNWEWVKEQMLYIERNHYYLREFIQNKLPKIIVTPSEGTFLAWLNFNYLNLTVEEIEYKLIHEAKIILSEGRSFGEVAKGFFRMNVGCPRNVLKEALERLYRVFGNY